MLQYLLMPLRWLWRLLTISQTLVFGLLGLVILGGLLMAPFSDDAPGIPDRGALVLDLQGVLVEEKTAVEPLELLQSGERPVETHLRSVIKALDLATDDDRIGWLVLDLDEFGGGLMPHLERVADAIREFKASGKPVIAASRAYSQSSLLLAAEADEILMNAEYSALPEGFAAYRMYFKRLFDDFDVNVNLFKVGKYKSAAEPYFREDMSLEDKEARLEYLSAWWGAYTSRIEAARALEPGSIDQDLANMKAVLEESNGNLGQVALKMGLVDQLVTEEQMRDHLIDLIGSEEDETRYTGVGYEAYLAEQMSFAETDADAKVAVITATGGIVDGYAGPGQIGSLSLVERIHQAVDDDAVKAVVLRVNSGGGSKTASEIIRQSLLAVQADDIPVVASFGGVAASGGYWISASADKIFAANTTITGSIGIFGVIPTFEKTLDRYGITTDGVSTTPLAGAASIERGISPAFAELIQANIEAGYAQFIEMVAESRGMTVEAVDNIAQGRVWTGAAAKEIGLVDEIGELQAAIDAAAELAELTDFDVWHVEPERSTQEQIIEALTASVSDYLPSRSASLLGRIQSAMQSELEWIDNLNDPMHAYAICTDCPALR
jgi:protease-4